MSRTRTLQQVQRMPVSPEEAWNFFAQPANLSAITPPYLCLKVTNKLYGNEVYHGQIITYKIKPLLRIPLNWTTEITKVIPGKLFVDEQREGPYALWQHEHHFKAIEGGVEMTDIVTYQLPFGMIGSLATFLVRKELNRLFAYRQEKIRSRFGAL